MVNPTLNAVLFHIFLLTYDIKHYKFLYIYINTYISVILRLCFSFFIRELFARRAVGAHPN